MNEINRIREIYKDRDIGGKSNLYAWHHSYEHYFDAMKKRMVSIALHSAFGDSIDELDVLDVGCGSGDFLRTLISWGSAPEKLVGTEFLANRLEQAEAMSPDGIKWHLGEINSEIGGVFDLVSAHTVFSSVLDDDVRKSLAMDMWDKIKPNGWLMVFDFRYNNPYNSNVRKVTRQELKQLWPHSKEQFIQTGLLAPPLSRRIIKNNYGGAELLTALFPFLRSHFIYMARK
jgi:SAM-dependent methyltransferase